MVSGADPGAGKGRGINRISCRLFERAVQYCIFEAANNHLLVVSRCRFLPFWPFQMVVKS